MKKQLPKIAWLFFISNFLIFLLSFLFYRKISLLLYINISFYIGALFIFISLLFLTIKSGFFDQMTRSFRLVFAGKNSNKKEIEEMALPSQMISINTLPFLINGLLIIAFMLIALANYS
ncbi:DUF3899 domain-containing protein [Robertmurraya sp. DFI.2.37]|uniref:DUF3899 domain-containing protein n=1 Tax=Robertmurraya sp. DFI.2.37 TaxID=3031819 RepID=UPI0014837BE2|nr:DUF3899 domain-containing protein [Robertmurraya sp. DFI.2.37]MDF1507443.1 DUF3899 domain-containing protein [Robertmurraya sp. DFI.2.37]